MHVRYFDRLPLRVREAQQMFGNQALGSKSTVRCFTMKRKSGSAFEADVIGATDLAVSRGGDAVIDDSHVVAVAERVHDDIQIPGVFAPDMILDSRQVVLVRIRP